MISSSPFNVKLLDPEEYIRKHFTKEITSFSIYEPSETVFHRDGLFSEQIFGQIGTSQRLVTFGYIDLHTQVFQPNVFLNIAKLGSIYTDVMSGVSYGVLNEDTGELTLADPSDENAGTGFQFFVSIFPKIVFKTTESDQRKTRIDILNQYKPLCTCSKLLVLPAGVRDLRTESGVESQEEINKLYRTILSYATQIPKDTTSDIFDAFRYTLQQKVVEVYTYIKNIIDGKSGFLRGSYGRRKIAGGTRNVISTATYAVKTPKDPQYLRHDQVSVGTFNALKANQLTSIYILRSVFFDPIFSSANNTISLVNKDTYQLEYFEVPSRELKKFDNDSAIEDWINRFKNPDTRNIPITVNTTQGPQYALMVHDTGNRITVFRNIDDIKPLLGDGFSLENVRPLTWVELFYMVATQSYKPNKHTFVTRYPVIEDGGCFPAVPMIGSTIPSRVVNVYSALTNTDLAEFTNYPILGNSYQDTIVLHASRLKGLAADFDGDTVSLNAVVATDANAQITEYRESVQSIIDSRQQLVAGPNTDNISWTFLNMSRTGYSR